MPLAALLLILNVVLIVHAAKTGRFMPWGFIILFLPGVGGLAYVLVELVPEWLGSAQGQQARRQVASKLDPQKRYRALHDDLQITDTIANRAALADECLALGKYAEAKDHFEAILARPMGEDAVYFLGRARAEFGLGFFEQTVATLDQLRERWPSYQSADGHLLYARALEEAGHINSALEEYQALADYFPGPEARVRQALLLQRLGRVLEAQGLFNEVLVRMKRAPKYVRKAYGEWIAIAEKAVGR
jgi:hypothetical protein